MEFTTTPEAKEAEMFEYQIRRDYTDGTFDVVSVEAESIAAALAEATALELYIAEAKVLCTIDHQPQAFLAW